MKFFCKAKDGGPQSTVTGYWLVEIKSLFSIVLLRFDGPSRRSYHEHAFNCVSWLLRGWLGESMFDSTRGTPATWKPPTVYIPSPIPFLTRRTDFHRVDSIGTSWVLSFRGPWAARWREYIPGVGMRTLRHGREVVQ